MAWQAAVSKKYQDIWAPVPHDWSLVEISPGDDVLSLLDNATPAYEQSILDFGSEDLLKAIRQGDLSAAEIVNAFAHRAILAHQTTRCLCENNLSAALVQARELDAHWRAHRQPLGPLHGLPVSLMDRFHVAGLDSACAFASWVGHKRTANDEGTLVRALRQLGAIVLAKSNVPMSLMLGETTNNLIGTTVNPYNRALSAGGACGGEGALIALRGSHLGFGTDVAGSSRIPASFCGLWALKTSEARLPRDGIATVLPGMPVASGSIGLISNQRSTLTTTFRALLQSNLDMFDPEYVEIPWRQHHLESLHRRAGDGVEGRGRLVFGVMTNDGHVRPHPPVERAIKEVIEALKKQGHEVVEWKPPPHAPAIEILLKMLGSTSASKARAALNSSGEPPIPHIEDWYRNEDLEPSSTAEFWDLCEQRRKYCAQYKAYWNSVGAQTRSGRIPDGVILPVAPTLAVRSGEFLYYGYSAIANVLDYTSGVIPITRGDMKIDMLPTRLEPLSEIDRKVQKTFRPKDIDGMPVGVQVMCPRLQEETVLGLIEAIANALNIDDSVQS